MCPRAPDTEPRRPPRIAVVVVPGVGDDGRGDTVDTLANSLVSRGYFDWAIHDEVVVSSQARSKRPAGAHRTGREAYVRPPDDRYSAPRRRLGTGTGRRPPAAATQPEDRERVSVDLYEMNWSDLSRFPSGLARFVFALFGLVLQLGRASLEALRGLDEDGGDDNAQDEGSVKGGEGRQRGATIAAVREGRTPLRALDSSRTTTRWLSLWMAIVIVPTTVLVALLGVALWLVTVTSSLVVEVGGLILLAAFSAGLTVAIGRGMQQSGLGPGPRYVENDQASDPQPASRAKRLAHRVFRQITDSGPILWVALVVLTGLIAAAIYGNPGGSASLEVGLANTLLGAMAGPLRVVWLIGVTLSLLALITLAALLASDRKERDKEPRGIRWRAASVGVLSVTVGPFVLALVSTALLTVAGSVGLSALGSGNWGESTVDLRCLDGSNDWTPSHCLEDSERDALREQIATADKAEADSDALSEQIAADGEAEPTDQELEKLSDEVQREENAAATADTIIEEAGAGPDAWLRGLASDVFAPVVIAGLSLISMLALALAATVFHGFKALSQSTSGSYDPRHLPVKAFGAVAYFPMLALSKLGLLSTAIARAREGAALSGLLRRLDSLGSLLLISLTVLAASVGTFWIWVFAGSFFGLDEQLARFSAGISLGVAAALIAVRLLPINLLEVLRSGLDIGYDIVTYVREGETAARFAVVNRYRALLSQIVQIEHDDGDTGYDGLIFVAHSQGTVYTAATLFGDEERWPKIFTLEESREERAQARLGQLQSVSMLSFGSPIRQLYDRFFAGQYANWYRSDIPFSEPSLAPLSDTWLNVYRPGDYVGRAVNRDPSGEDANLPGSQTCTKAYGEDPGRPVELREACINSPGAHTGYWDTHYIAAYVDYLIQRAAAPSERVRNDVMFPDPLSEDRALSVGSGSP
ncbi:MAG: hypothetical protein OEM67_02320 [Thermoleophilia bacterium]|nr:hypothetical protein [Thermoleophilia bacterium]MDH3724369.1 hypothetical protein [Thermoleophilia bacterium]